MHSSASRQFHISLEGALVHAARDQRPALHLHDGEQRDALRKGFRMPNTDLPGAFVRLASVDRHVSAEIDHAVARPAFRQALHQFVGDVALGDAP